MTVITVFYPRPADGEVRFDFDYYENSHMASVRERLADAGLVRAEALRGLAGPDGGPAPFVAIALLEFASPEAFQASMSSSAGGDIMADVPNFTNLTPTIQISEVVKGKS